MGRNADGTYTADSNAGGLTDDGYLDKGALTALGLDPLKITNITSTMANNIMGLCCFIFFFSAKPSRANGDD